MPGIRIARQDNITGCRSALKEKYLLSNLKYLDFILNEVG